GGAGVVASANSEHAELLSQVNLFRGLDRVPLAKVAGYLEPLRVSDGESLFLQGDAGDALYLVSAGSFGVDARGSTDVDDVLLNVIHRGDAVGEIATQAAQSAGRAHRDV